MPKSKQSRKSKKSTSKKPTRKVNGITSPVKEINSENPLANELKNTLANNATLMQTLQTQQVELDTLRAKTATLQDCLKGFDTVLYKMRERVNTAPDITPQERIAMRGMLMYVHMSYIMEIHQHKVGDILK